jgi:hypothetical protein
VTPSPGLQSLEVAAGLYDKLHAYIETNAAMIARLVRPGGAVCLISTP